MFLTENLKEFLQKKAGYIEQIEEEHKDVIKEASGEGKITDLWDMEELLDKSPSPYNRKPPETVNMLIRLGVAHPTEKDLSFTFEMKDIYLADDYRRGPVLKCLSTVLRPGISAKDFSPKVTVSPAAAKNDEKNIFEVMNRADFKHIFRTNYGDILRFIEKYIPVFYRALGKIRIKETVSGLVAGVGFNKNTKRLTLYINVAYLLKSSVVDYINNKNKYDSLRHCYVFTAAFIISHEVMHALRHTAGLKDVEAFDNIDNSRLGHHVTNSIMDNYIDVSLSRIFQDEFDGVPHFAGEGELITGDLFFGSENLSLPGFFTPLPKVFRGFSNPRDISETVMKVFERFLRVETILPSMYGSFPADYSYKDASFLLKMSCYNLSLFEGNSTPYVKIFNNIIKDISKEMPIEDKPVKGKKSLVGKRVRCKNTGKIGVVIDDDLEGNVVVVFIKGDTNIIGRKS